MPSEGSPPQPLLPSSRLRRRCRLSCIPRSCFGSPSSTSPREEKEARHRKTRRAPWFSLRKVKRSLSVRGGMSVVVPKSEEEGRGKEGEGKSREIPAIIVESVRPTFLQGLFTKGGRARRSISSHQENRSEAIVLPCSPPPSNHPIVPLHSSPRSENGQNGKLHESCYTARTSPHSPCNDGGRRSKKKPGSLAGFVIVMVMLLMLAVGGRVFATTCTSAFLYLSSYFMGPTVESDGSNIRGKKHGGAAVVDYRSEEYREKVLMDGMLKRDGRRLAS